MSTHVSNGNVNDDQVRQGGHTGQSSHLSGVVTVTCPGWSLGGQVVMFKQ